MTISVVGTPAGAASSASVSITIPATARLLVAGAMNLPYGMTITGCTCGVDALTAASVGNMSAVYYKVMPTPGTVTLAFTGSGAYLPGILGVCFTGGAMRVTGYTEADKSITTVTRVGDWIVGCHGDGTEEADATPGWGGAVLVDYYYDPGSGNRGNVMGGYVQASTTSTAFTITGGGNTYNGTSVAHVYEVSVGNQVIFL